MLAAAAGAAHLTVEELASAMAAGARGAVVPRRVERALRRAVAAARTAGPCSAAARPLVPSRARTEEALGRFRASRARLRAAPADAEARQAMDDATYTLCVLMGRPTPYEALRAAELRLAPAPEELPRPGLAV